MDIWDIELTNRILALKTMLGSKSLVFTDKPFVLYYPLTRETIKIDSDGVLIKELNDFPERFSEQGVLRALAIIEDTGMRTPIVMDIKRYLNDRISTYESILIGA